MIGIILGVYFVGTVVMLGFQDNFLRAFVWPIWLGAKAYRAIAKAVSEQ